MSRKFKLVADPCDAGYKLYKKRVIEIKEGVTVLVGCNGFGKSTLLRWIGKELDKEDIEYVRYDNEHDGGSNSRSRAAFRGNLEFLATSLCSSEGENIVMNVGELATRMGRYAAIMRDKQDEYWFLLDAIDSGLSIDNIVDVKNYLFKTVLEHNPDKSVYILVTANSYELCRGEQCFDVHNGVYREFEDYEDYRYFITCSRMTKEKRYEK